jgi:hypothetical protein
MCPATLRASWVASTKRCKDAGLVHSSAMDETEDAAGVGLTEPAWSAGGGFATAGAEAARRGIAGQEARERRRVHH